MAVKKLDELPAEIQVAIIKSKIIMWENTSGDAQLDAEVGAAIDDNPLKADGIARMKKAANAISILQKMLEAVEKGDKKDE